MADEVYRLSVPIEVRDGTRSTIPQAKTRVDGFKRSTDAARASMQRLNTTKASPTIKARDDTRSVIDQIRRSLGNLVRSPFYVTVGVRSTVGKGLSGISGSLRAATSVPALVGGALIGGAIGALGAHVISLASDLEGATIGFATMFDAANRASGGVSDWNAAMDQSTKFLSELQDFANKTPFEFPELRTSAQRLMAFGFSAEQILPMMTAIGDASAGMNLGAEGINRITTALGQMKAKGRVQGDELLQLTEAGIPAIKILSEGFGMAQEDMQEAVTKGIVPANKAIRLLLEGIEKRFPNAMDRQSKTMAGMFSTLKDTLNSRLLTPLGQGLADAIRPAFAELTSWLDSPEGMGAVKIWGEGLKNLGSTISAWIMGIVRGPFQAIGRFFADPAFLNAPDKFGYTMGRAWDFIVTHSGPLGDWLVWFKDKGWPGIKSAGEAFWNFINDVAIPVANTLGDWFKNAKSWIKDAADEAGKRGAWDSLKESWQLLGEIGGLLIELFTGRKIGQGSSKDGLSGQLDVSKTSAQLAGREFSLLAGDIRDFLKAIKELLGPLIALNTFLEELGPGGPVGAGSRAGLAARKAILQGLDTSGNAGNQGESLTIAQGSRLNKNLSPLLKAAGFSEDEIAAACGPIAAAGIGKAFGMNVDPAQILRHARQYGWSEAGMGGVSAFQNMLASELGIQTTAVSADEAIKSIGQGGVAAISTPLHYWLAQGYNPQTGQFDVGETGQSIWGKRWMTLQEIQQHGQGGASFLLPTRGGKEARLGGAAGGGDFGQVGKWAASAGLDVEGQRVAMAIARTEGSFPTPKVGDAGQSFGLFQFHKKGELQAFANEFGMTLDQAAAYVQQRPDIAAQWALGQGGYLGEAIRSGQAAGYHGADLAWYAQEHGQRSKPEGYVAAKSNYLEMFNAAATSNAGGGATEATNAYRDLQGLPTGDVGAARGGGGSLVTVNLGLIGIDDEGAAIVADAIHDLVAQNLAANLPHILANARKRRAGT